MLLNEQLQRIQTMMGLIQENKIIEGIQELVDGVFDYLKNMSNFDLDMSDIHLIREIEAIDKIVVRDFQKENFDSRLHIVLYINKDVFDFDEVLDLIQSQMESLIPHLTVMIDDLIRTETGESVYGF